MKIDSDFKAGLPDADELPLHSRPSLEGYLENYWWIAYDRLNNVGLMVHFGTMRHDFDLIRQTIMVFLPNRSIATDVSYGRARREENFIAASTLSMQCEEPYRVWKLKSSGMLQLSNVDELWKSSIKAGPRVPCTFEIEGLCIGPVWSASKDQDREQFARQKWSSSHYQQTIRLTGNLSVDGVATRFDGTGVRDHSRGPRDLTGSWAGHALCSAPFGSGRSFGMMLNYGPDGSLSYNSGYVVKADSIERGRVSEIPRLSSDILGQEHFSINIELAGRTEHIEVNTRACGLLSMLLPCDTVIGFYRDRGIDIGLGYAMAEFDWDGETAAGIIERSSLISAL